MKTLGRTSCVGVTCQWLLLSVVFGESHEHYIQWGYYVQLKKSLALIHVCEGTPLSMNGILVISCCMLEGIVLDDSILKTYFEGHTFIPPWCGAILASSLVYDIFLAFQPFDSYLVSLPPGTPTLMELLSFSDKKVNIAERIGVNYYKFGIFLLEDSDGVIVKALEKEHLKNAEEINMAILQRWLEGKSVKPVTWSTLVTALQNVGM